MVNNIYDPKIMAINFFFFFFFVCEYYNYIFALFVILVLEIYYLHAGVQYTIRFINIYCTTVWAELVNNRSMTVVGKPFSTADQKKNCFLIITPCGLQAAPTTQAKVNMIFIQIIFPPKGQAGRIRIASGSIP